MDIQVKEANGQKYALVPGGQTLIDDVGSALDLMATVQYETDLNRIAIYKEAVTERFFVLSSGLAGEILQKFVNYHFKLAIIGDFSKYTSKPLRDFIYESNHGSHVFFVSTENEAAQKFASLGPDR